MRSPRLLSFTPLVLALAAGCVAPPPGPPEQVAPKIVALLDEGKVEEADAAFADGARGAGREQLYPLLYEAARTRYDRGEATASAGVLRFMARHYPQSIAVRESLAYALFVERAGREEPDPALVGELGSTLALLGERSSPWIHLISAQHAIDSGQLPEARQAFTRFMDARPEATDALAVYIEDIDRYLRSHP